MSDQGGLDTLGLPKYLRSSKSGRVGQSDSQCSIRKASADGAFQEVYYEAQTEIAACHRVSKMLES